MQYLYHKDWNPIARDALNHFIAKYGKDDVNYDNSCYAVFDFDNTIAIFDVQEQTSVFQLERMAFAFTPDTITDLLFSGFQKNLRITRNGCFCGTLNDWIADITGAYRKLFISYGPFSPCGLSEEQAQKLHLDPYWLEFVTKMWVLYDLLSKNENGSLGCLWNAFWFSGMTRDEQYRLACKCFLYYRNKDTALKHWHSPDIDSNTGKVSCSWTEGISISENMQELIHALHQQGIHVWVCSASTSEVVKAAIDTWNLHDDIDGVIALTSRIKDGISVSAVDDQARPQISRPDGKWYADGDAFDAFTSQEGKVEAILHSLVKRYGHGPNAGFMDSEGDFNFCTEFSSMRLALCINHGSYSLPDGGGLVVLAALYQQEYPDRIADTDTRYYLQGRNENNQRSLIPTEHSIRIGNISEEPLLDSDMTVALNYLRDHSISLSEFFRRFSIKTKADSTYNCLGGIAYGFLDEYRGYHSI